MNYSNEGDFELQSEELIESTTVSEFEEPDLDNTTFFAEKEYLDGLELSFPQKVEKVNAMLLANSLNRPSLYRILTKLESTPLPFDELEAQILEMTEYSSATQPPSVLIEWLANVEAVDVLEVDEDGNPLSEEACEGKTEDEIDDMVYDILVAITDMGKGALEDFNPAERIGFLFDKRPQRNNTYIELLTFLKEKHSYNEIDNLLRGNPILLDGLDPGARPMQPSVFVDKLASAGAIVFDSGWIITPEGEQFLKNAQGN